MCTIKQIPAMTYLKETRSTYFKSNSEKKNLYVTNSVFYGDLVVLVNFVAYSFRGGSSDLCRHERMQFIFIASM